MSSIKYEKRQCKCFFQNLFHADVVWYFKLHTCTFNVLMPLGLHRIMMQTQVTRIRFQHAVDPVEHSKVNDEPHRIPEDCLTFFPV